MPRAACCSAPIVVEADWEGGSKQCRRRRPEMIHVSGQPRNMELGIEQLSPLDHSAILDCINPKAFWFPSPGLRGPRLKASLGKLLRTYPLLAGRISVDGGGLLKKAARERLAYCISICNAGVEFLELPDPLGRSMSHFPLGAMIRTGFSHMGPPTLPDYFSPMDVDELLAGREPLLKVRLTQLSCGGSILALTLAHAIQDGHSAAMFLNDWAKAYRQEGAAASIHLLASSDGSTEAVTSAECYDGASGQKEKLAAPSMNRSLLLLKNAGLRPMVPSSSGVQLNPPSSFSCLKTSHSTSPPFAPCNKGRFSLEAASTSAALTWPSEQDEGSSSSSETRLGPDLLRNPEETESDDVALKAAVLAAVAVAELQTVQQAAGGGDKLEAETFSGECRTSAPTRDAIEIPVSLQIGSSAATAVPGLAPVGAQRLACLALQELPKPDWPTAMRRARQLVKEVREQEVQWPGSRSDLSSLVLHLPADQVAGLKVLAASGRPDISTNDAVAGLVWTLMCHLRGRPLPGRAPPGCPNCLGLAVDLRRNGLSGALPLDLFANATWCLHVPIGSEADGLGGHEGYREDKRSDRAGGAAQWEGPVPSRSGPAMTSSKPFVDALRHSASQVRASLKEFRSQGPASGWGVVDHAARLRQAPLSAQLQVACNVISGQDAMLSSWQFPYWAADFGAGGPLRYLGALHPTPPWSSAVMAAHPSQGGMYLFLVVPSSARSALRSSAVLAELVPGATFA